MPAELLPLAVATAASPLPLLMLLVVLLTPRAVPNGLAFAVGWTGALLVVGTVAVVVVGTGAALDQHRGAIAALEALVGLALLYLAVRQWNSRPRIGREAVVPGWLMMADRCTPWGALGMGAVLVVGNPKNLALTVAAAGAVARASPAPAEALRALVLFAAVGSAGVAVPLVLRIALGTRAVGTLRTWRRWLVAHGTPGACAVLAVVGGLFVVRAVTG